MPVGNYVCESFVDEYLAGLRGYRLEARALLARALQDSTVSVEHARVVCQEFDHLCPTPREIKDVAYIKRELFVPPPQPDVPPDATYEPGWSRRLLNVVSGGPWARDTNGEYPEERKARLIREMVRERLGKTDMRHVSLTEYFAVVEELGFGLHEEIGPDGQSRKTGRLNSEQRALRGDYRLPPAKEVQPDEPRKITAEDVERARREREEHNEG